MCESPRQELLDLAGLPQSRVPGLLAAEQIDESFIAEIIEAMGWHRFWERA